MPFEHIDTRQILVKDIKIPPSNTIKMDKVNRFAEVPSDQFPPVQVVVTPECYILKDGGHRCKAAEARGEEEILAEIWCLATRKAVF